MIGIFTIAYNQPVYLPYQIKLLRKYLTDPFEFTVIDNSHSDARGPNLHSANTNHKAAIQNYARDLGFRINRSVAMVGD